MIDSRLAPVGGKPHPMGTVVRYILKSVFLIGAIALIGLAVLVQSGRSLFPLLERYQEPLASYLSSELDLHIQWGGLDADWQGLQPSIRLFDLVVDDEDGHRLISANQAYLRLNLFSSVLERRWALEKVELRNTRLSLFQGDDGFWGLPGLPQAQLPDDLEEPIDPDALLELFQLGTRVELLDTQVKLLFANQSELEFLAPYLLLEHQDDFHRLSLQIDLEERERALFAVVEGRGDPRDARTFATEGYLQLRRFPTLEPLTALGGVLMGEVEDRGWYRDGRMDASFWFSNLPEGEGFSFGGQFGLDEVGLPIEDLTLDSVSGQVGGEWRRSGRWQLVLQSLTAEWRDRELEPLNLSLSALSASAPVQIMVDRLGLEYWSLLSNELGLLGTGRLQDVVQTMQPRGELRKLQLSLPQDSPENWQLLGELADVEVNAWQGVPGLSGVSGFLEADRRGGSIDLDSRDGFSMYYPEVYQHPMHYHEARGQVAWHLMPEKNRLYVNSGTLELRGEGEQARGSLWLMMPWEPDSDDVDLYLNIEGEQLSAPIYAKYLPQVVPEPLAQWLERGLGEDNPGQANRAHFVYRGTLNTPESMARSYQLSLDMVGGELDYHDEWPALSDLSGRLYISDNRVDARIDSGRLYNSQLTGARIGMDDNPHGEGGLLTVEGQLDGLASDALRLLQNSYLNRFIGDSMDTWSMRGEIGVDIDLAIPLPEGEPGARQNVSMALNVPEVDIADFDLVLRDFQGQLNYSDTQGLHAERLNAQLFDEPLQLSIATDRSEDEAPLTRVAFSGEVDIERLAQWSNRPELYFLEGKLAYDSRLELIHNLEPDETQDQQLAALAISSDLEGVALDLPPPYGKIAEELRPTQLNLILGRKTALVDLRYDEALQALAQLDRETEQLQRANLALDTEASLPEAPGIHFSGRLESLNLERWQEAFARYQTLTQPQEDAAPESPMALAGDLPISADIDLGHHRLGPLDLEELSLDLDPVEGGWQLVFQSSTLAGELDWIEHQPLALRLNHLHLSSDILEQDIPGVTEDDDSFDPRDLPDMALSVDQLTWDGNDFGQWRANLISDDTGVRLSQLEGEIRGLIIGGSDDDAPGADVYWQFADDLPERTLINAQLSAGNLADVLAAFDQADLLESESARYQLELSWPGAPQSFAVETLTGDVGFSMQAGRFKRNPAGGSDGFLRLFAVLNFDSLARRMRLDFSDLYQSGLAYDSIDGAMSFDRGLVAFSEPVQVLSPSSRLQLSGTANALDETLDTRLVATLPVAGNLTFLTALAAGLPAAAGVYLVSKLFERQVDQATSISYTITGDWDDPQIRFDRMFDGGSQRLEPQD